MVGQIINNGYLAEWGSGWATLGGVLAFVALAFLVCALGFGFADKMWKTAALFTLLTVVTVFGSCHTFIIGNEVAQREHVGFYEQVHEQGWSDVRVNTGAEEMIARRDGELEICHFVNVGYGDYKIFCED